jgi:hypothetical protein
MKLIVLQITLLVLAILYLCMGAGEREKFCRASDLIIGVSLFILLYVSIICSGGA